MNYGNPQYTWSSSSGDQNILEIATSGTWSNNQVVYHRCQTRHKWLLDSLRGTNRNQRVEHLICVDCGQKRARVWMDLPKQGAPDREYGRN